MSIVLASQASLKFPLCNNNVTKDVFQFKNSAEIMKIRLPLESLLLIQCCVQMASPSVTFTVNGRPLEYYNDTFSLFEQGQVLVSNIYPPAGWIDCIASNGSATLMRTFILLPQAAEPCCLHGHAGEIRNNEPPADVYNVTQHHSLQLECVATIRCGYYYLVNFLQWHKRDLRFNNYTYSLEQEQLQDDATGDYVNVSFTFSKTCNLLTIHSTLTITNVSENVFYRNNSVSAKCDPSNETCGGRSAYYDYVCDLILPGSDYPGKEKLKVVAPVKLHEKPLAAPSTAPPLVIVATAPNPRDVAREGLIAGCSVGAFVILIVAFAVFYSKFEWHIKLYVKRLLLMIRPSQSQEYQYHCYVACCRDDEPFVYNILVEELEKKLQYRFCLPERDFPVGEAIPEQIAKCLENSEYFLAVISSKFWDADWCSTALNTALRTNVKVIILHVKDEPNTRNQQKQVNVLNVTNDAAKALNTPGCVKITYRKKLPSYNEKLGNTRDTEKLILKLQCFMPKLRYRAQPIF